jgi:hypothetical protein
MQHFANFELSPEQKRTADSLNYLRQNDPEEFNRVKTAGQAVRKRNQNVNVPIIQKQVAAGGDAKELFANNRQNYNQPFTKATNANQAAGAMGKIGNTAKRWGGKVAGLGGAAVTASMLLPMASSLLPFGKGQTKEENQPY